ncbi:sugar ABC transporter substrate-binding protein [Algibacillus agarilyticus]|uniref:sugar ABC transporter substrate-binding protein n=1 Tax=Algibacillus agarilyticus TaxID=2234133 RepID=UPI000DCFD294|nr:extracellular solute-binding protein [Algibacillus agarilyticus]
MLIRFLRRVIIFIGFLIFNPSVYSSNVSLTLWHNAIDAHSTLNWAAKKFQIIHPNVDITVSKYPVEELKNKLIESSINQSTPDAILISSDLLGYTEMLDLSPVPLNYRTPHFYSPFDNLIQHNNYQFAIPIYIGNHLLMYYNQTLVEKPFTSFETLITTIDKDLEQQPPIVFWDNQMYWFISVVNAFNGFPIINDKVKVNRAALAQSIMIYKQLFDAGMISSECDLNCIMKRFHHEKTPYLIDGLWAYRKHESVLGKKLGVAVLPWVADKQLQSMRSAVVLAFPQQAIHSEKKEILKTFALFLQSEQVQKQLYRDIGCIPIHQSVIETLFAEAEPEFKLILNEYNRSLNLPPNLATVSMWPAFAKGLHFFIDGLLTASDAVLYIEDQIKREHSKALHLNQQLSD